MIGFTPEELAELAAFDAEIDAMELDAQDYAESRQRDKDAIEAELSREERQRKKAIKAYQREYMRRYRAAQKAKKKAAAQEASA